MYSYSSVIGKDILNKQSLLQLNNDQPLIPSWILAFTSCIMGGNQVYNSFMQSPSYLGALGRGGLSYETDGDARRLA